MHKTRANSPFPTFASKHCAQRKGLFLRVYGVVVLALWF